MKSKAVSPARNNKTGTFVTISVASHFEVDFLQVSLNSAWTKSVVHSLNSPYPTQDQPLQQNRLRRAQVLDTSLLSTQGFTKNLTPDDNALSTSCKTHDFLWSQMEFSYMHWSICDKFLCSELVNTMHMLGSQLLRIGSCFAHRSSEQWAKRKPWIDEYGKWIGP